jgi:hypothetical protein
MKPEIFEGEYFQVDTSTGTEIVSASDFGVLRADVEAALLTPYLEGEPTDPLEVVQRKSGWLGRMSAPGYMDRTDWNVFDTQWQARTYLIANYQDDD